MAQGRCTDQILSYIWAVLSDNAPSGNTDFLKFRENGSTPILSLCVARHDMTNNFFLFQVLSILYLFDQEMEPEQAEPPPHSHGQQPLSAVSNRTRSRVAQRSSCVARVIIGASSGVP